MKGVAAFRRLPPQGGLTNNRFERANQAIGFQSMVFDSTYFMHRIIIAILILFVSAELLHQGILLFSMFGTEKANAFYRSCLYEKVMRFLENGRCVWVLSSVFFLVGITLRVFLSAENIKPIRTSFSTYIVTVISFSVSLSTIAVPLFQNVLNHLAKYKCGELLDLFSDEEKSLNTNGLYLTLLGIMLLLCDSIGLESSYINFAIIIYNFIFFLILYQFKNYIDIFIRYVKGGEILVDYLLRRCSKDVTKFNAMVISCINIARKDLASGSSADTIAVMRGVDDFIANNLIVDTNNDYFLLSSGITQLMKSFCELMKELIVQRCTLEDFETIEGEFRNAILKSFDKNSRRMGHRNSSIFSQMYRDLIEFCCQEGCIFCRRQYVSSLMNWIESQTFAVVDYGHSN